MDSYGTRVATGSKDTTVAVASVTPTGMSFDRVLGDCGGSQAFHEKVVKGVSLRDESTVRGRRREGGRDACVRVCVDERATGENCSRCFASSLCFSSKHVRMLSLMSVDV